MAPSIQASAVNRLKAHASALDNKKPAFKNPNHLKFAASPPPGQPVWYTPLNPVQFLLRSAFIRPNKMALKHPALGIQWTYAEW